jgi:hypothetical protein
MKKLIKAIVITGMCISSVSSVSSAFCLEDEPVSVGLDLSQEYKSRNYQFLIPKMLIQNKYNRPLFEAYVIFLRLSV